MNRLKCRASLFDDYHSEINLIKKKLRQIYIKINVKRIGMSWEVRVREMCI